MSGTTSRPRRSWTASACAIASRAGHQSTSILRVLGRRDLDAMTRNRTPKNKQAPVETEACFAARASYGVSGSAVMP